MTALGARIIAAAIAAAAAAAAGCAGAARMVPPPVVVEGAALAHPVAFVVLPAVDQRPRAETHGHPTPLTFAVVASGAAIVYQSGALTLSDRRGLRWTRSGYPGLPPSASTTVSSDLGDALRRRYGASVQLDAVVTSARDVGRLARERGYPDGTVVVLPVLDHLTRVTPHSSQTFSSSSSTQVGATVYRTTTVGTTAQLGAALWVAMMRVHVFEIRGGRVARHVVRYAARSGKKDTTYGETIVEATAQIGLVVERQLGGQALLPRARVPDARRASR